MILRKPRLTLSEKLYLPAILRGMALTFRHLFRRNVTLSYPEHKHPLPDYYRGLPGLVKDQDDRTKCVSCFLCEWICPPKAITIRAQEIPTHVEKGPKEFEIDFLRCILCGYCEEVCPEEAIFMTHHYEVVGTSRAEMVYNKEQLLQLGGVRKDDIKKWDRAGGQRAAQEPHGAAQLPDTALPTGAGA